MPMPVASRYAAFATASWIASPGEGRHCELSRQATVRLLFPGMDARPGPWLLLLAAACSYVAVRALETAAL